ncbi:MAG: (Fe-S)-binding protein [Promethearchaeota archaeon]
MEILEKYKWMLPLLKKLPKVKRVLFKNMRNVKKNFYPEGEYKADVKNLINCMLCPNMCRFDCGSLRAAQKETMSPAYKARIGYYLTMGKLDYSDPDFLDLMYKCTNDENCKIWCPFDFSVVSLLETVREDINDKGYMPDYCKQQIAKLEKTNTIEDYEIFKTYKEKGIENIESDGNVDVFYYVGCEMMKFPEVVKANIEILKKAGVKFALNLNERVCCGAPAFNIRALEVARNLANKNKELFLNTGTKLVISDCPGCVVTLSKRYQQLDIKLDLKIVHITQYFNQLITEGKLTFKKPVSNEMQKITIHDPCLLARNLKDTRSIREILGKMEGIEVIEPIYNKEHVHCCGWSGTLHLADKNLAIKEATNRIQELKETEASMIVTTCPLCELGLAYGLSEKDKQEIKILDLSTLIYDTLY